MSRWRFGCGEKITVWVPRGLDYRELEVECGSTAHDGGVNQCERCANDPSRRPPRVPDYGDDDL